MEFPRLEPNVVVCHHEAVRLLRESGKLKQTSAPKGALEVKILTLLGNYDRPTNQPTGLTDRGAPRELSLPIGEGGFDIEK